MECCYVCGGIGYCRSVFVRQPSGANSESVPFFPFLERHPRPAQAQAISPDGTASVCPLCYAFLLRQWWDNEQRGIPPARRMYFVKRLDGGPFTGADPSVQADFLPHMMDSQMEGASPARTPVSQSELGIAAKETPLPSEHHIRCFVCHNPCLKWNAKTAYSTQVLESKEFFPFLERLESPSGAIPLTHGATKICATCETDLFRQWEDYAQGIVPQDRRVYRISVGSPPSVRYVANTSVGTVSAGPRSADIPNHQPTLGRQAVRCGLCSGAIGSDVYTVTCLPRAGQMYFPFLSMMRFGDDADIDRDRGEVQVCERCHFSLTNQWNKHESARIPIHRRQYSLPSDAASVAPSNEPPGPIIAQCHLCLTPLRDPHTLKTLRAKESPTASAFFPFLSSVRGTTALSNSFPVCDHCYWNMIGQWKDQSRAGIDPGQRRYTHTEYVCSRCGCLRAEKGAVQIVKERIVCRECAAKTMEDRRCNLSVPTTSSLTVHPTNTNGQKTPRSSLPSLLSSATSSTASTGRTTVIVPPMSHHQSAGHTSIAGQSAGTYVSQSANGLNSLNTYGTNAAAAAAAGYAEALRQLAKQVSNESTDGPSAFRADPNASKKQPIAAVAPNQRMPSNDPTGQLTAQMQAYLNQLALAQQQPSPWAMPSQDMEQQMAVYNQLYRNSLLQAYYPGRLPPSSPVAGLYPPGLVFQGFDPTSHPQTHPFHVESAPHIDPNMLAAMAWQQRLLAAAEMSGHSRDLMGGSWPGWSTPDPTALSQYLAWASAAGMGPMPSSATHQSFPTQKSPSSTPQLHLPSNPTQNGPPTDIRTPYRSATIPSQSQSAQAKAPPQLASPKSRPLPGQVQQPKQASLSNQRPVTKDTASTHTKIATNTPAASLTSNNRSTPVLNLSAKEATTLGAKSGASDVSSPALAGASRGLPFSISGLVGSSDVKAEDAGEEGDLVLDLSKSATSSQSANQRSPRVPPKLYRPFEVEEEPMLTNERTEDLKGEITRVRAEASTPLSVEEHFRRSLAAAGATHHLPAPLRVAPKSKIDMVMERGESMMTERLIKRILRRMRLRIPLTRDKVRYFASFRLAPKKHVWRRMARRREKANGANLVARLVDLALDGDRKDVRLVPFEAKHEFAGFRQLAHIVRTIGTTHPPQAADATHPPQAADATC